ncbi:MAG: hypothetical protein NT076_03035 [Candidatus Pacearchaeota archaeon]|nr:hypothetical protein [Candidatus Pacearchaeota archaeon]
MARIHDDACRFSSCLGCRYVGFREKTYGIEKVERGAGCIHPEAEDDLETSTSTPMPDFSHIPNELEIRAVNYFINYSMQTRLRHAGF